MNDQQIIALFFDRSEQAILELSGKYGSSVRRAASNILHNAQDVEECSNDTYYQVWNQIPPKQPKYLGAFTCRIARNICLNRYYTNTAQKRSSFYETSLDELEQNIPALSTVESEYAAKELGRCINSFVKTLPYDDRFLFVRRYWYADPVAQIAQEMGIQSHNATVRLSRIRKKLQNYLQKEGMMQ